MHIKVIRGDQQVTRIEREFAGFVGATDGRHFWISSGVTGSRVAEVDPHGILRTTSHVGLAMFDGPFRGGPYSTDS